MKYLLLLMSIFMMLVSAQLLMDFKIQPEKCDISVNNLIVNIEIEKKLLNNDISFGELYQTGKARQVFISKIKKEWIKAIFLSYAVIAENLIIFCVILAWAIKNIFFTRPCPVDNAKT